MILNGLGKKLEYDGAIYIGGFKNYNRTEGKMYELQDDHTHTLYNVKYDEDEDEIER
jgi:hypothetical protein